MAMTVNEAGYTEIPDEWIQQFKSQVKADPTAGVAWKVIENAGLEQTALLLLWGFAGGAKPDLAAMHRRTEDANDVLKAVVREESIARATTPKRAHDPDLFHSRATKAHETAMSSPWPVPTVEVRTLGDELAKVKAEKGRQPPLTAVRKALTKAVGKRSLLNTFHFLLLLQGYAADHGVQLGNKRLVALTYCASPNTRLDEGTLGRYLRSIPQSLRDSILRDTLPTLPRPTKR